jgi:hypothetical protein
MQRSISTPAKMCDFPGQSAPATGRRTKVLSRIDEIIADFPRTRARNESDLCCAICPDLPKVL